MTFKLALAMDCNLRPGSSALHDDGGCWMNISAFDQSVEIQSLAHQQDCAHDIDEEASDIWDSAQAPTVPLDTAESGGPIQTQTRMSPRSPPRHLRPLYASIDLPEEDDGENLAGAHRPTVGQPTPPSQSLASWQWLSSVPASGTAQRVMDDTFVLPLFVNALGLY